MPTAAGSRHRPGGAGTTNSRRRRRDDVAHQLAQVVVGLEYHLLTRGAVTCLQQVSYAGQLLLAAELLIARVPGGRSRLGRQAALASAVWMLDPRRRAATRTVGRVAGEWARLRVGDRHSADQRPRELLPSALGATERQLGRLRLRLRGG